MLDITFTLVGIISNLILYFAYLAVTHYGVGHKLAMSLLYVLGVLQTFVLNKKWTFSHHGYLSATFQRYIVLYGVGYLTNLGALVVFVDRFGYPHQWVQGVMILVIAVLLFAMQRSGYFVSMAKVFEKV